MLPNRERAHDEGKSHFDAAPPPSPLPVYLYFTNRFQKERNTLGLSGTAQSARRERGGGRKKTKKIIIKMSHRESPMRVARARKKKKKKNSEILLKSGGNPFLSLRPPSPPPPDPYFLYHSALRVLESIYLSVILVEQNRAQTSIRSYSTRVERICHLVPSGFPW